MSESDSQEEEEEDNNLAGLQIPTNWLSRLPHRTFRTRTILPPDEEKQNQKEKEH